MGFTQNVFRRNAVVASLLASLILSAGFVAWISEDDMSSFIDLEIETQEPTAIQIFYDTGDGFSPKFVDTRRLTGKSTSQYLRFMLPLKKTRAVRIDFEKPASRIIINSGTLVCLTHGSRTDIDLKRLKPRHNIESIRLVNQRAVISAAGPDPQLVLPLKPISNGVPFLSYLWIAVSFMVYPLVWYLFYHYRFSFRRPFFQRKMIPPGRRHGRYHWVLIAVSAFFWVLAAVHISGSNGEKTLPLPERTAEHTQKPYKNDFIKEDISLAREDGLKISAAIYKPQQEKGPFPALLLLHGNYPQGQSYPLYQVLAQELAHKGYLVMTVDFAGYGSSEDPFARLEATDVTLELETKAALDHLVQQADVQPGSIGIIGHSMGADPALRVGARDAAVKTLILIGPPRRVQQLFHSPADIGFFWYWAHKVGKEQYGREQFPEWYGKKQWLMDILNRDMLHMLPYLSGFRHKPVLFVDGEHEPSPDKQFLSEYFRRCSQPKEYVTLPKANHDCNVTQVGDQIVYDPVTMTQLVWTIDTWYAKTNSGEPDLYDYGRNLLHRLFSVKRLVDC